MKSEVILGSEMFWGPGMEWGRPGPPSVVPLRRPPSPCTGRRAPGARCTPSCSSSSTWSPARGAAGRTLSLPPPLPPHTPHAPACPPFTKKAGPTPITPNVPTPREIVPGGPGPTKTIYGGGREDVQTSKSEGGNEEPT